MQLQISAETCLKEALAEKQAGTPYDTVVKMIENTSLNHKEKEAVKGKLARLTL